MYRKKGYSFLEIIVVLAIISFVLLFTTDVFSSFNKNRALYAETERVMSIINEARAKTVSSKDNSEYGTHFEQSKIVSFKGAVFNSLDVNNKEVFFSGGVEIYNIALNGGGADLFFKKFTGETDKYGTVSLRLKQDNSKIRIIKINKSGVVSVD